MVKKSGKHRNTAKGGLKVDREKHYVLENRKTGKIASSNNWLNALAAIAVMRDQSSGIVAALPLKQATKLLQHNKVVEKNQRSKDNNSVRKNTREQAKKMIPTLAVFYEKYLPSHKPPRVNEFCKWVVQELQDRQSEVSQFAESKEFHDLIDSNRTARWWQDQL